jgi:hypothetical protein
VQISRGLSERFARWPGAAKQTDVPGHTWIFPSLLVRAGIRFLHLGCNAGSHPPHVPRLFWWEGPDGARLLTFYSAGGYGTSALPPTDWTHDTWLALQHTIDNHGPHTPDDLRHIREEIERGAPNAEIVFGQLHDFGDALLANPDQLQDLPVLPYDLADTWIHGLGTMPREVARVRELRSKLLALECIAAVESWPGEEDESKEDFGVARQVAPLIDAAYEQLLLFGEHTWGLDVKSTIKRAFGAEFEQARQTEPYKRLESSWRAKTAYVDRAESLYVEAQQVVREAALESQALRAKTRRPPMEILREKYPDDPMFAEPQSPQDEEALRHESGTPDNVLDDGRLRVEVDPQSGGIVSLFDRVTGREWVSPTSDEPFGGYRYDLYSAVDIAEFLRAYGRLYQDWFLHDFGKVGYPEDTPHVTAYARDFTLHRDDIHVIRLEGGLLRAAGGTELLPQQEVAIQVSVNHPYVYLDYHVKGKQATPLTESAVVPFPFHLPKATFRLGQVGSVIDPTRDIASGANRHLWCVDGWVDASDSRVGIAVMPQDMPLVSIGDVGIYKFSTDHIPTKPTIYSHLFNTQWGTNFPQWHEGDFHFRVKLRLHPGDWRTWRTSMWWDETAPVDARGMYWYPRDMHLDGVGVVYDLSLDLGQGLVLQSVRPRHDGHGLIVRFWDALGTHRNVIVSLPKSVTNVWRCDLMERPVEKLRLKSVEQRQVSKYHVEPAQTLAFTRVAAHAIETILLEFN